MSEPADDPAPSRGDFWRSGEVWFMLASILLVVGIVFAFARSLGLAWWYAVPISVVVGIVMVAVSHTTQGGGGRVVEIGCSALLAAIFLAILRPVFEQARGLAMRRGCADNLRRIGQGLVQYATDHEGRLPPAEVWADVLVVSASSGGRAFGAGPFECPAAKGRFGYAYHASASGRRLATFVGPLVYDGTENRRNASSRDGAWPARHPGKGGQGSNVLFADGRVRWHRAAR